MGASVTTKTPGALEAAKEAITTDTITTDMMLEALPGDRVLQRNALATVTTNCLIVRSSEDQSQTIIPIVHLASVSTAKTTYPGLLVISAACLLIAAGAYCSGEEGGAAVPAAMLGLVFLLAYGVSRKVAVAFRTRADRTVTSDGSTKEAKALIKAIRSVQAATRQRDGNEKDS